MDNFFVVAIVLIVVLITIRIIIRRRYSGQYVEVFQTTSRSMSLPESVTRHLKEAGVRYRIVFKGPPNQPFIGMSGEQFVSLEVHIEDLERGRRIVSKILNDSWRGRS